MAFRLYRRSPKKGKQIQALVEVNRYATGVRRYEARPVRMAVQGRAITFRMEDFVTYSWTRQGARRRCLEKVIAFLRERAKEIGD